MDTFILLVRLARPHFLLGGIVLYALGAGIADYLGVTINWNVFFIGLLWGLMVQLSTHFLNEYFDGPYDMDNQNRTPFTGGSGTIGPGRLPRAAAFWGAVGTLAAAAYLTLLVIQTARPNTVTLFYMLLIFLAAFFYAVPPVRLEASGYGELTTSILVAHLVPGFAFLLQSGELHRLVAMSTFPLVFLSMAMLLAFELPDFANDLKHEKRTLMVRIGWQAGMRAHNILIFSSFALLVLAAFLGLPLGITLPALLPLPLALLQTWNVNRIAAGAKPNWTSFTLAAVVLFFATAYLLAVSFWLR